MTQNDTTNDDSVLISRSIHTVAVEDSSLGSSIIELFISLTETGEKYYEIYSNDKFRTCEFKCEYEGAIDDTDISLKVMFTELLEVYKSQMIENYQKKSGIILRS